AREVSRVVVGDDHPGVGVATADRIAEPIDRGIVAGEAKALALGEGGDQLAALRRAAVVDHGEADIGDVGAEREAEERELQDRRQNQRELEPAVATNLVELLADQGEEAVVEEAMEEVCHGYAFTCMRLMPRQASE